MEGPHLGAAPFKVDMSTVNIHDVVMYDSGMMSPRTGLRKSGLTGNLPYMLDIWNWITITIQINKWQSLVFNIKLTKEPQDWGDIAREWMKNSLRFTLVSGL